MLKNTDIFEGFSMFALYVADQYFFLMFLR